MVVDEDHISHPDLFRIIESRQRSIDTLVCTEVAALEASRRSWFYGVGEDVGTSTIDRMCNVVLKLVARFTALISWNDKASVDDANNDRVLNRTISTFIATDE